MRAMRLFRVLYDGTSLSGGRSTANILTTVFIAASLTPKSSTNPISISAAAPRRNGLVRNKGNNNLRIRCSMTTVRFSASARTDWRSIPSCIGWKFGNRGGDPGDYDSGDCGGELFGGDCGGELLGGDCGGELSN